MTHLKNGLSPALRGALFIATLFISLQGLPSDGALPSEEGNFLLAWTPSATPLPLNSIHEWTLDLSWRDGRPVEGAAITVEGGMPEHNHGMPTALQAVAMDAPGQYLLEGVRFHMMGKWELELTITADGITDTVTIALSL